MWAEESCRIVQQPEFYPGRRVPESDYAGHYLGVANERLEAAGHRLARLLNAVLVTTP
jgi:nuclease S1